MILDPFQRFLGVPRFSDPLTLLGLSPDQCDPLHIEKALHERLSAVYRHPDARSPEADDVRQALRAAAEQLRRAPRQQSTAAHRRAPKPAVPSVTKFNLTPFDRLVLAVLVGCGGWNAQSRARLVALAGSYGVTVQGLMRVMKGLADYARSGGPPLGVSDMATGRSLASYMPASSTGTPAGPALLDRLAENLAVELRRDDPWPTIKLSIIFGVVTLMAGVLMLRLAVRSESPPQPSKGAAVVASESSAKSAPPAKLHRASEPLI